MATAAKKRKPVVKKTRVKRPAAPRRRATVVEAPAPAARRRARLGEPEDDGLPLGEIGAAASEYFASMDKTGIDFVSSGAALIDCMLGGGWACGRVANVVGDKSAGKTLLAIEACANFHLRFPKAKIRYAEAEAAFDTAYAEALGMPVDAVEFATIKVKGEDEPRQLSTVEEWHADVLAYIDAVKKSGAGRGLYILDSLDALSDDAEQGREMTDSSFGANKAKKMGELFRRLVRKLEQANILLIVISQLRDKIGVMFGEKQTRTGGRALDYYASHIVWLAETGKIKKTIGGVERIVGVNVKARVKKNKVGLPFRDCVYPILFGYGVDDLTANVEWLFDVAKADKDLREKADMSPGGYQLRIQKMRDRGGDEVRALRAVLRELVISHWQRVEAQFLPKSRKY